MEINFNRQIDELREKVSNIIYNHTDTTNLPMKSALSLPEDIKREFFCLVDKVNVTLMEDQSNFYGYFVFQMGREIRFDISSPTAVNFKGAQYIIYFNPILFLNLNLKQMESSIKHEILHIVSMHLIRAKELKGRYSKLVINMAMDLVVNKYLSDLPPYATTLEGVNVKYTLNLEPYASFEYYAQKLQTAIDLVEDENAAPVDDREIDEKIETEYDIAKTHDLWDEIDELAENTLLEFTQKVIQNSEKGVLPAYLESMITSLKDNKSELPWNLYLNRLMGMIEGNKKKTITRRNRRQPERLELRGELRSHKAKIIVAIDISGSISDEEFKQAMNEVLGIVKNHNHEITVIECDDRIRRTYVVKTEKDIKERFNTRGNTSFSPVFEYANHSKANLLVYFTDGKGEDKLKVIPNGYPILWVISGRGEALSLKNPYGTIKKLKKIDIKDNILDISDVDRGGYSMNNQEKML